MLMSVLRGVLVFMHVTVPLACINIVAINGVDTTATTYLLKPSLLKPSLS